MSRFSRKCGILDISQPYRLELPVARIGTLCHCGVHCKNRAAYCLAQLTQDLSWHISYASQLSRTLWSGVSLTRNVNMCFCASRLIAVPGILLWGAAVLRSQCTVYLDDAVPNIFLLLAWASGSIATVNILFVFARCSCVAFTVYRTPWCCRSQHLPALSVSKRLYCDSEQSVCVCCGVQLCCVHSVPYTLVLPFPTSSCS
jgi:hypothetical protein